MTQPNQNKAVQKAIEATNFCTKHQLYHGQKFKDCTPQERTLVEIGQNTEPSLDEILEELAQNIASIYDGFFAPERDEHYEVFKTEAKQALIAWADNRARIDYRRGYAAGNATKNYARLKNKGDVKAILIEFRIEFYGALDKVKKDIATLRTTKEQKDE